MQRLDKVQKEKVAQFQSISGTSVATAIHCLQASNWASELALDIFYSSDFPEASEEEPSVDEGAIVKLFETYKDKQQVGLLQHKDAGYTISITGRASKFKSLMLFC